MKILTSFTEMHAGRLLIFGLSFIFLLLSCNENGQEAESTTEMEKDTATFEIITEAMEFQSADTIPSGWYTWRYVNKSTQPHFILIDDYPDSVTLEDFKEELLPVFGEGITLMYEGKNDSAMQAFGKMPAWFAGTKWPGGVGLISPEMTAETILKLTPGTYIMECYVKMENGMFHTNMGMYKEFHVSEEDSGMKEPKADVSIEISKEGGIVCDPPTKTGTYTFGVNYLDQATYEHFQGHDVHLVKIEENYDLDTIENWMSWMNLDGLIDPVPEGFTFLGGVNDMPGGSKGYFIATLDAGNYALISEVPSASEKGLLQTFEIPE